MFDLTAWKKSLSQLFGDFIMEVQALIDNLPTNKPAAEDKLDQYGKELIEGSDELAKAKATFAKLAEAFLKKFPPAFSDQPQDNLREFEKLIVLSLRSGNKDLLVRWGVEYPRAEKFAWMNNSAKKQQYIDALTSLRNTNPGAESEYDYLINCLKQ